jgi:hypothetical protein
MICHVFLFLKLAPENTPHPAPADTQKPTEMPGSSSSTGLSSKVVAASSIVLLSASAFRIRLIATLCCPYSYVL